MPFSIFSVIGSLAIAFRSLRHTDVRFLVPLVIAPVRPYAFRQRDLTGQKGKAPGGDFPRTCFVPYLADQGPIPKLLKVVPLVSRQLQIGQIGSANIG